MQEPHLSWQHLTHLDLAGKSVLELGESVLVTITGLLLAGKLIPDLVPGGVGLSFTSANRAKRIGGKVVTVYR